MRTDREFSTAVDLPQFPGRSVVTRYNTSSNPDQATAQTIDAMRRCVVEDSQSPVVFEATRQALSLTGDSIEEQCCAIFDWIKQRVEFRQDDPVLRSIFGLDDELDLLIRPARLLTMSRPAEDCDGFTMLACSMLLCAQIPCEFVTLKADRNDPSRFSHVYCCAVRSDGARIPLDCSHGPEPGWEAPDYYERKSWGVMYPAQRSNGLHGYAGLGMCPAEDPQCDYDTAYTPPTTTGGVTTTVLNYPGMPTPGAPPLGGSVTSGSGFDLNRFIQQITAGGLKIAQMQATPVGYVQTPNMIANYGAGAAMPLNLGSAFSSINPTTLLLLGGGLIALLAFSGKR